MSFGMKTWGATGLVQIDENSFTVRIVLSTLVSLTGTNTVQSFAVPAGCTSANCVAFVVPIGAPTTSQKQYETLMRDDGFADVYNYIRGYAGGYYATGTMRLMVMRFK